MAGVTVAEDEEDTSGLPYYRPLMLVLALDTTTRGGSCAIARDGVVLAEHSGDAAIEQAVRLPRDLMALLDHTGLTLGEVDVCAVATGPGSFTGLRVGIATMQGLAFAGRLPLIGVSAFDALAAIAAAQPDAPRRVATWVDAWRGDVFAALYDGTSEIEPPSVSHPQALLAALHGSPTFFIGDGAGTRRDVIEAALGSDARMADPPSPALAGRIAVLATALAVSGELPPPHAIRPLYVRRSDTQPLHEPRHAPTAR